MWSFVLHFTESTKIEMGVPASPQQTNAEIDPSIDEAGLKADVQVIRDLQNLESEFSCIMIDTSEDLKKCDIGKIIS